MNFNRRKLIIFDCDGVLVDSETIANRIEAESLSSIGIFLELRGEFELTGQRAISDIHHLTTFIAVFT